MKFYTFMILFSLASCATYKDNSTNLELTTNSNREQVVFHDKQSKLIQENSALSQYNWLLGQNDDNTNKLKSLKKEFNKCADKDSKNKFDKEIAKLFSQRSEQPRLIGYTEKNELLIQKNISLAPELKKEISFYDESNQLIEKIQDENQSCEKLASIKRLEKKQIAQMTKNLEHRLTKREIAQAQDEGEVVQTQTPEEIADQQQYEQQRLEQEQQAQQSAAQNDSAENNN